jgi:hypothetical protein
MKFAAFGEQTLAGGGFRAEYCLLKIKYVPLSARRSSLSGSPCGVGVVRKFSSSYWGLKDVVRAIVADPLLFLPVAVAGSLCVVLGAIFWFGVH